MTPAQLTALNAELRNDPESLGYPANWNAGADNALADTLNSKQFAGPIPITELASFCCTEGITGGVMALAEIPIGTEIAPGVSMTVQIKGLLHTVLTLIQLDFRLTTCDVDDAKFGQVADALIGLGVMTAEQKTAIIAMAANRLSRAEVIFGQDVLVKADDVETVRKGIS